MTVREARFSRASHEQLAAGTVKDTMQYVWATFRENGYPNPSIDNDGLPAFILQREFRSFKNTDPEENIKKQYQSWSSMGMISYAVACVRCQFLFFGPYAHSFQWKL
jgi:hypothetical protein